MKKITSPAMNLFQKFSVLILVVTMLTSCSTTSDSKRTKAEGTAIGSVIGAAIGYALGDKKGATFGASIGYGNSSIMRGDVEFNTEEYDYLPENNFQDSLQSPLSTFSIDVDTASYSNIRRFLHEGELPPKDAVRIEEMINYFDYDDYPEAEKNAPFAITTEIGVCPWRPEHKLFRVALKGKTLKALPPSNLVFLIDVSGSMDEPDKLPLIQKSMKLLVKKLGNKDKVAIVVYAGTSGLALPATLCTAENKTKIISVLESLEAGGGTQGSAGIELAYKIAQENFISGGNNRVILATDGDFNVGITNQGDLVRLIEEKAKSKIYLTVLGFGEDNIKDSTMKKLADTGNGNYGYIDNIMEAKKILVDELRGTLFTIAKDVKIQVEFNPAEIKAYRLIGYESRLLKAEEFSDDKKDAGEIGAGHRVTALYELISKGGKFETPSVDPLKYQKPKEIIKHPGEILTVKLRYKEPDSDVSKLISVAAKDAGKKLKEMSKDFKFAAAVAEFGMILRDSKHKGNADYKSAIDLAKAGQGNDEYGYRAEFISLVKSAQELESE